MMELAERIAWEASCESGLDDRPHCDPSVLAVCYLGLRLCPMRDVEARVVGRRLIYPDGLSAASTAYYQAHECGHELGFDAGVPPQHEERIASRVGVALLLPRLPYLRDLRRFGWNITALRSLWPLGSTWVHARRIAEVWPESVVISRWNRHGCVARFTVDDTPVTPLERSLALAALSGSVANAGPKLHAWPDGDGAVVVCDGGELRVHLDRGSRLALVGTGER